MSIEAGSGSLCEKFLRFTQKLPPNLLAVRDRLNGHQAWVAGIFFSGQEQPAPGGEDLMQIIHADQRRLVLLGGEMLRN